MKETDMLNEISHCIRQAYGEEIRIEPTTLIQELRGFDSLFLTNLIDLLEERMAIELAPHVLVPESFETPVTILDAFLKSHSLR